MRLPPHRQAEVLPIAQRNFRDVAARQSKRGLDCHSRPDGSAIGNVRFEETANHSKGRENNNLR